LRKDHVQLRRRGGAAVNVVEYTCRPGDTDGDGDADLADYAYLQSCPAESPLTSGPCLVLDGDKDGAIMPDDSAGVTMIMSGPH
jgi:hypothetical protein